jgi:ABC-type lipoprotein release transport system permease subunit
MKSYKMAWRNLWRNKRRTLITVASVFFAVFFALLMRSLQLGSYNHMFRNVIESYTGYIQIQDQDFWDSKTIDNVFEFTPALGRAVMEDRNAREIVPRLESFALASSGQVTKGVLVLGIDPEKEIFLSDIRSKLVKYRITAENAAAIKKSDIPGKIKRSLDLFIGNSYTSKTGLILDLGIGNDDTTAVLPVVEKYTRFSNGFISTGIPEALIGDKLSVFLKAGIGDTLVLIGQGYHGTTAAGKYRISGIVKLPTPDFDNKIVYLPVDICQELYNAPGMLTSLAVSVKKNSDDEIDRMITSLGSKIELPMRVIGWREMNKLMISQMDADSKSGIIMIAILYLVIAFGIFGTVLMMTAERRREFGVLVAIGMQKTKLAAVVVLEMVYIGIMGIASGIALSLPMIMYGYYHPIRLSRELAKMYEDYGLEPLLTFMPPDIYFFWQSVVISVIVIIAVIYPVRKIFKTETVNSLKA